MAQVTITLNGRTYRLQCGDGEEPRLIELADVVRGKLQSLVSEFGQAGDDRLLLMTALLIADELLETRARLASLAPTAVPVASAPAVAPLPPASPMSSDARHAARASPSQPPPPPPSHRAPRSVRPAS